MALADVIGNERIREGLLRAIARDRLPHALLFAGPEGIGKRTTAIELARALECQAPVDFDACGACPSCHRVGAGEHPDLLVYEPDGTFIKIAQVRDLAREAHYQPFEGRRRVLVVDGAHRMRDEAANAMLKTLEEPPPTSLLVLVTDQPYALLETIRSRCQTVAFAPVPVDEIERFLTANFKRPKDETRLLARIAKGRVGRALATDLSVYRERRKEMFGLVEVLASPVVDRYRLLKAAQYLSDVAKKERSEFDARLEVFTTLCRDLYGLALGQPVEGVANVDMSLRLEQMAAKLEPSRIARWAEAIDRLREQMRQNVNRQLALEALLLDLAAEQERRSRRHTRSS